MNVKLRTKYCAVVLSVATVFSVSSICVALHYGSVQLGSEEGRTSDSVQRMRLKKGWGAASLGYTHTASARQLVHERLYSYIPNHLYLQSLGDLNPEGLLLFTAEAQAWIWERQNPEPSTCAHQPYLLVSVGDGNGIGSAMHICSRLLAVALQQGRILMWQPDAPYIGGNFADPGCGRNESFTSFHCFFQPLTTCTAEDMVASNNSTMVNDSDCPRDPDGCQTPEVWRNRIVRHFAEQGTQVTAAFIKVWWRAQSVAYVMRLNRETADAVRALRLDPAMHNVSVAGRMDAGRLVPFPLPPATVSMHVRHGDKHKEMQLIPFAAYMAAAEKLVVENPLALKSRAFVSTEDQGVITDANALVGYDSGTRPDKHWVVYTSNIHRFNGSPFEQLNAFGRTEMTLEWILQLWMALECDVWVGTRGSNWNRLIDELRCTLVDKCQFPYLEVGMQHDWIGYND